MIHQFSPEISLMTPKGEGFAMALIDYGLHLNPVFLVALCGSGEIICVTMEECKRMGNAMLDIPDPKQPTQREVK